MPSNEVGCGRRDRPASSRPYRRGPSADIRSRRSQASAVRRLESRRHRRDRESCQESSEMTELPLAVADRQTKGEFRPDRRGWLTFIPSIRSALPGAGAGRCRGTTSKKIVSSVTVRDFPISSAFTSSRKTTAERAVNQRNARLTNPPMKRRAPIGLRGEPRTAAARR